MIFRNLQSKPTYVRKAVFWLVLLVLALAMGFWWFQSARERLSGLNGEILIRDLQLPEIEIPDIDTEQ